MRLLLLGPFEVVTDLGERRLPGRGERALLALLALSAGQVVPTNALVDALWSSGDLPVDPGNALQVRVSKLRRALAALDPRDLVRRDGSGYRLDLDPASVDAHRFAALVEAARSTGDPQAAVDTYGQALSLWRGDPLVDFAGAAWTLVESGRLAELRLAAIAERADRMLTLGRFEQTVADLEPVVAAHPPGTAGRPADDRAVQRRPAGRRPGGVRGDPACADRGTRPGPSRELRVGDGAGAAPRSGDRPWSDVGTPPSPGGRGPSRASAATGRSANLPLRLTSFVGRDAGSRQRAAGARSEPAGHPGRTRGRGQDGAGDRGCPACRPSSATAPGWCGWPVSRGGPASAGGRGRAGLEHRGRHRRPPPPRRAGRPPCAGATCWSSWTTAST